MEHFLPRRRITVEEYHRIGEAGIFADDQRLELIEGELLVREPIGSRHAATVDWLTRLWIARLGERAIVRVQNPIQLPEQDSEPQPDVTLLRPRPDFYAKAHPRATDVLLVIEVADSSLLLDRRVKVPLYGRAGVQEAWLIDLTSDRVEVDRDPAGGGYADTRSLRRGAWIVPLAFADLTVAVDDVLGPPA